MTTSIALETSKGNLERAVAIGIVLIAIIMAINAAVWTTRRMAERYAS
jgi:tungstate transport system permease protein